MYSYKSLAPTIYTYPKSEIMMMMVVVIIMMITMIVVVVVVVINRSVYA
jgi:hypothetical protein